MSTINGNAAVNNVNQVEWSYSTKIVFLTDRPVSPFSLHDEITTQTVENLGVGVTVTNAFTNLS